MPKPAFKNDYNDDGKAARDRARDEAGWRCIRCLKPHQVEGKPFNNKNPKPHEITAEELSNDLPHIMEGERGWILTVHHFDGNKANDAWWNLLALCQRCHLQVQNKCDPEIPYMFEHSDWLKPFVAGFYAKKYLGEDLTRPEVEGRLEELLALERKA